MILDVELTWIITLNLNEPKIIYEYSIFMIIWLPNKLYHLDVKKRKSWPSHVHLLLSFYSAIFSSHIFALPVEVQTRTPRWKLAHCLRLDDAKRHGALRNDDQVTRGPSWRTAWKHGGVFGKQPLDTIVSSQGGVLWKMVNFKKEKNFYNSWASLWIRNVMMMMIIITIMIMAANGHTWPSKKKTLILTTQYIPHILHIMVPCHVGIHMLQCQGRHS